MPEPLRPTNKIILVISGLVIIYRLDPCHVKKMETIHYSAAKKVNTTRLVEDAILEVSYKFWFQLITAFQAAFAIVLAFQVNDIVTKLVDMEHISARYAAVIPILIVCNLAISYMKDKYVAAHDRQPVSPENSVAGTVGRVGSVHHFYHR